MEWVRDGLPLERLTLSSDGGGCLPTFGDDGQLAHMDVGSPDTLLHTIRGAVSLGLGLHEALQPVTATPARLFRLHRKGAIAPGTDADLLVLDRDLHIRHVFAGGRLLVRDGNPVVRGLFERAAPRTS